MQKNTRFSFKKFVFSDLLIEKSASKKIAYVAVITAFLTVSNAFLEIKFTDIQFSLTLTLSMLAGVLLGGGAGFCACFIADGIGFIISSWGFMYMPWVGLTSAVTALMAGLIYNRLKLTFKGGYVVKLLLICLSSFILGTVLINTTGFYFYNYNLGFSTAVIDYVKSRFGGEVTYFTYLLYRLIFKGQIFNCLFNYALVFILTPLVTKISMLKNG